ncbi:hypothetical protein [Bacillus timonensis]|nr:hypothetical protein [Bacillus timonensis]
MLYLDDYIAVMNQAKESKSGVWSIPGYAGYNQPYHIEEVKQE